MSTKNKRDESCKNVPETEKTRSEERFVRDLLIRNEAAETDYNGELPAGATHKIVGNDNEGLPEVERERFSIY